ncbi:MAG: methyltransferase [Clostridia bacterium]|nr:methyltransferase [Clostridia bacterium]
MPNEQINNTLLLEGEKFEDLQLDGLQIIQSDKLYRFTSDSVLLANYVKVKNGDTVIDLGTGSGIIAILVSKKTDAGKIVGVEIQTELADMATRSVSFNKLDDKVKIKNIDLRDAYKVLGNESADIVVCNPPYEKSNQQLGENANIAGCNAELLATLEDFAKSAKQLLKYSGKFYLIIKAKRMSETLCTLSKHGLEPKVITLVVRDKNEEADTVMIEAKKGGSTGVKVTIQKEN